MPAKRNTINDVAKEAGVSKATVSYILNQRQSGFKISEDTTLRVLEICQKLNYEPDVTAVLLAQCKKQSIKILVFSPWLYDSFSDLMIKFNRVSQAKAKVLPLNISYRAYTRGELSNHLRTSLASKYDTVIVVGTSLVDDRFLARHHERFPNVVLINRRIAGYSSAFGNDGEVMEEMVKKLDLKKYRHLAVVAVPRQSFCENRRCEGFAVGIAEAHRRVERIAISDYHSIWPEFSRRFFPAREPILVFVPQYIPAAFLIKQATEAGVRVPEELGVVAYDNHSLLSKFITPTITTVEPHLEEMVSAGIDLACNRRDNSEPTELTVRAEYQLGGSTCNKSQDKRQKSTAKNKAKSE